MLKAVIDRERRIKNGFTVWLDALENYANKFQVEKGIDIQTQANSIKTRGTIFVSEGRTLMTWTMAGRLMVTVNQNDNIVSVIYPEEGKINGNGLHAIYCELEDSQIQDEVMLLCNLLDYFTKCNIILKPSETVTLDVLA